MTRKASITVSDLVRRIWAPEAISIIGAVMFVTHLVQHGFAWTPRVITMIAIIALGQMWTFAAVLSLARARDRISGSDGGEA